mmetsp:Transcript_28766/g.47668  ORF Transcript_28766/g.47668 Transcript_28766/m.47668 type:complete len:411 (-) Transcript_28766:64-1296(-)|eukprot:CAMPEP_0119324912 /NCGR_PEP_ID=MMETSP1333-20130426/64505_1 /TAXON_ID=418940 /ORGANISM="Scyphosphaera apsteinii, Strain RCC1455" /LENGTH=410 /DNA_ID=CAMNT_0007332745 /DNA_START=18 /DNA_END=1250 /DNA_ORIENTATION=+
MDDAARKALHANIFGDEDSDEDDEENLPTLPSDVQRILSAPAPKSKARSKAPAKAKDKQKAVSSSKSDAASSGTKKHKRLKRSTVDEEDGGDISADVVDGVTAAATEPDYEGEEDEEDEEGGGADQAIVEGGRGDFEGILKNLKRRRGQQAKSRDVLMDEVSKFQTQMEQAAERDDEACQADVPEPAVHKVQMLKEVVEFLKKRHLHETMIDQGMLGTIAKWLRPMPDGSLVSMQVRTHLLQSLTLFEVDETVLGALKSSKLGKYVKLLALHCKEHFRNKQTAKALIEKWQRPIFQSSVAFHATDVEKVVPRVNPLELGKQDVSANPELSSPRNGLETGDRLTANKTRVPRPAGMDFTYQPTSSAQPMASTKYAKESTKGKLQDKMLGRRKTASTQAVTLSVEGRILDRL